MTLERNESCHYGSRPKYAAELQPSRWPKKVSKSEAFSSLVFLAGAIIETVSRVMAD